MHKSAQKYIMLPMIFPLEQLIEYQGNIYEITCAAVRRAYQLSMLGDPEVGGAGGKVVSIAARQLFTNEVEYQNQIEEQ